MEFSIIKNYTQSYLNKGDADKIGFMMRFIILILSSQNKQIIEFNKISKFIKDDNY